MPIKPRSAPSGNVRREPETPPRRAPSVPVPSKGRPSVPSPTSRRAPSPSPERGRVGRPDADEEPIEYGDDEWFGGFGGVPAPRERDPFIQPGKYIVSVVSTTRFASQKPGRDKGSQFFKLRLKIEEVLEYCDADDTPPSGWGASNPEGEIVCQLINAGRPRAWDEKRMQEIKGILLSIFRCESPDLRAEDYTDEEWVGILNDAVGGEGTKWAGYRLMMTASKKITLSRTNFTVIRYQPSGPPTE